MATGASHHRRLTRRALPGGLTAGGAAAPLAARGGTAPPTPAAASPANYSGYGNPKLDDPLKQAKEQSDSQQQIPMDDLPVYYARYRPFLHVAKTKFAGYVDSVDIADMHGLSNTLQDWYVAG